MPPCPGGFALIPLPLDRPLPICSGFPINPSPKFAFTWYGDVYYSSPWRSGCWVLINKSPGRLNNLVSSILTRRRRTGAPCSKSVQQPQLFQIDETHKSVEIDRHAETLRFLAPLTTFRFIHPWRLRLMAPSWEPLQDFRISQPQARYTYLLERYSMHIAS